MLLIQVEIIFQIVATYKLQAAFQTALTEEFMRIRATNPAVGPNEAAALALNRLRERSPELLAARG